VVAVIDALDRNRYEKTFENTQNSIDQRLNSVKQAWLFSIANRYISVRDDIDRQGL
jgi:hypothetical protein